MDHGIFAANIPNDFQIPVYDPADPLGMLVPSTALMGFNPLDPEAESEPWEIAGMNVTGAWKYTRGRSDVLIAIVDNGLANYSHHQIRRAFYLNAGELPLPNEQGQPCVDYDCNGDGRFDADDYADDDRVAGTPPFSAHDLILAFSDGVDDDGNGLADDISGWDFYRNVSGALGASVFPLGIHAHWQTQHAVSRGDDGSGVVPGVCPECRVLPIRASFDLVYDFNRLAAAVDYARAMGADVIAFAGANFTWSAQAHQAFVDAYEHDILTLAVAGDELNYHHWMPAAGEDVLTLKTIYAMVPVDLTGWLNLGRFGFAEGFCTNYGSHTALAVPAESGCSSEGDGLLVGAVGLLLSWAKEREIELSANEVKQLLTMTAYDIADHCVSSVNLLGECQEGFDEHFAYGRPDIQRALSALGDPDFGLEHAIPPAVRITSPLWWETFDPEAVPDMPVIGSIDSRVWPVLWRVQIAAGHEPSESAFQTVASQTAYTPLDGKIASVPLHQIFSTQWASGRPQNQYSFEVTLRVRATYETKAGATVLGEARKAISVHIDSDPETGLVSGFPFNIGASGESAPVLYDLDGHADRRLEIVLGTGDGKVAALAYDPDTASWGMAPGFPVDVSGDDPWVQDAVFGSVAVGDLFGDGTPEIVVATTGGNVYAIDPAAAAHGDPILPGFPVQADPPDNTSASAFAQGNGFYASSILADLDNDGMLEIVAGSLDQKVYAWKPRGDQGIAQRLDGWPVLCKSEAGKVPEGKVCIGDNVPAIILGTPAVGVLDPTSSDPHIRDYPTVVATTSEVCEGQTQIQSRAYAIFHDGENHPGGPFLPGWPATPAAPLGDAIPLLIVVGSSSAPSVAITEQGTVIAVGSTAWLPQLIHYAAGETQVEDISAGLAINTVSSPIFSSLRSDESLQYILPMTGAVRIDELGFSLLNSRVTAFDIAPPNDKVLQRELEDIPMLVSASVADLDNDGAQEVLIGTGGYLVHAFSPEGGEAPGWPKYTHKWVMATPAVGDLDNDGRLEVVAHTREGMLYAWESRGDGCPNGRPNSDWRRYHHDEHNSGFYGFDPLPPIGIADLTATRLTDGRVRLAFTAPGDDWVCGNALGYDIRFATESSVDLSDPAQFFAATRASDAFSPLAGGMVESFLVNAPDALNVAMRAQDANGNVSRISNVAVVAAGGPDDDDDDTGDDDNDDDDSHLPPGSSAKNQEKKTETCCGGSD